MDRIENTVPPCCSSTVAMGTYLFGKSSLSNGSSIFAYLTVVVQNWDYMLQYIDTYWQNKKSISVNNSGVDIKSLEKNSSQYYSKIVLKVILVYVED
jgi:hypothetical protein